jgi:hypothetical protein
MNVSGSEDKETTPADATKVLIVPKSPLGEDFLPKSVGKAFPQFLWERLSQGCPSKLYTFYNPAVGRVWLYGSSIWLKVATICLKKLLFKNSEML